jgi:flagellar biosynthesis component FlhA
MNNDIPQLVLRRGPLGQSEAESIEQFFKQVPQAMYYELGIVTPLVQQISDDTLAPQTAILELNGRSLGTIHFVVGVNPVQALGLLEQNAAELVEPILVEFYLSKLNTRFPILVETIRKRFTIESLCGALRSRVERRQSIRDFPGVLEEILAESV